ncbi:MAG: 4-phosphoerythronate dehydrogenase [Coxiellaceae bacterium]|nr:4-phosphoerythronate dehydrogenase [Coxiellaceae bacterium]
MKIIYEQNIPFVSNFFTELADLHPLASNALTPENLKDADALLVRSVNSVNATLLRDTPIRFVGSASAGFDHLDIDYLNQQKIAWAYAPGCNAQAVADYVLLSVAHLLQQQKFRHNQPRVGIIGMGYVGQRVFDTLNKLGFDVVVNDPPRADNEVDFESAPLDKFHDLDLICVHTALTMNGPHPSYHLIDQHFLEKLNPHCVLLNASRGACIDSQALKKMKLTTILDVWENEPNIDVELVESAYIATQHIAGWSLPSKYHATRQLYDAFCSHFEVDHYLSTEEDPSNYIALDLSKANWMKQAFKIENLEKLSEAFKQTLKTADNIEEAFRSSRKNYRLRPEFIY